MTPHELISFFGTQAKTAKALRISQPTVAGWVKDGEVPELRQWQVELGTKGALKADMPPLDWPVKAKRKVKREARIAA